MPTPEPTTHQAAWWRLLFYFRGVGTTAQVCGFSLGDRPQLACLLCLPLVYQSFGSFLWDCSQETSHRLKGGVFCLTPVCLLLAYPLCGCVLTPYLLPTLSYGAPTTRFWMLWERKESLQQHSKKLGKPDIHSLALFPLQEKLCAVSLGSGMMVAKSLFLLATPKQPNLVFFLFLQWNASLLEPWTFTEALLSLSDSSISVLQALPNHNQEEPEVVHSLL